MHLNPGIGETLQYRQDRLGSGFAKDIDIELMKLTAATLLRFLVAKALADLKPLERLGDMTLMLGREARQRR